MSTQDKEEYSDIESVREDVYNAKLEILRLAAQIDPLLPLRRHPLVSVGSAFLGGACMGLLRKSVNLAPFLPIALEAGELLLKKAKAKYD